MGWQLTILEVKNGVERTKLPASSYIMRNRVFCQFFPARSASSARSTPQLRPRSQTQRHDNTTQEPETKHSDTMTRGHAQMSLCRRSPSAMSWQGWSIIGAGGMIHEKAGSVPAAAS